MTSASARILVFAKAPLAGQAKTRLIPVLGAARAAALHEQLVRHTLATVCAAGYPVELWCSPDSRHPFFSAAHAAWPLSVHNQSGGDLGARMAHACADALTRARYVILTGSDCPGMTTWDLRQAVEALSSGADAVVGPARDGGYWLIGLRSVEPALFEDMAWGGATVLIDTLARLHDLQWRWVLLPEHADIDRPEDLAELPPHFITARE